MLESYFVSSEAPAFAIQGTYNFLLVALSYLIAFISAFVALDMAAQMMRETSVRLQKLWCLLGAIALGGGIWSMHFTGMLAYQLPTPHTYSPLPTFLSFLIPIAVVYLVFRVLRTYRMHARTIILCSLLMGTAILLMHYMGMSAIKFPTHIIYRAELFVASALIAILASAAAISLLYLASLYSSTGRQLIYRVLSALFMGLAVCGMHYTGLEAAIFLPLPYCAPILTNMNQAIAVSITAVTLFLLTVTALGLYLRNRMNEHLQSEIRRQTASLQSYTSQLMQAKETAEESSIAKTEFLANMSHEIRTPLNAIVGISDMLRNYAMPPERSKLMLATLHESALQLMQLLDDVLDLSRIEIGDLHIEATDINLHETIAHVVELLNLRAQEKNITLEFIYSPELPTHFLTDAKRIRQIFINLVSNAIKFTHTGGITIAVYPASKNPKRLSGDVPLCLEVEDSGIGIDPEKLPHIFEKFYQADSSTTRQYGGTGLGLAITKKIVDKMQGTIEVESSLGKGSTFRAYLTLPCPAIKPAHGNSRRNGHPPCQSPACRHR